MLVVILLQSMEPTLFVICGINVMKRVVSHIVAHVADEKESPENGETDGIMDWY